MDSDALSPELEAAVKRFQKRHNLAPDGVVGNRTLAAMNVPVEDMTKPIVINIDRQIRQRTIRCRKKKNRTSSSRT